MILHNVCTYIFVEKVMQNETPCKVELYLSMIFGLTNMICQPKFFFRAIQFCSLMNFKINCYLICPNRVIVLV